MEYKNTANRPINNALFLLRIYIDMSIIYCLVFPLIFIFYGAFWAALTQFFCALGLVCARLAYHYRRFALAKFVSLASSYIAITTQMFLYMPKEMGFHYLYLALLIVAVLLFQYDHQRSRLKLGLFTLLIVLSFFACEFYGLEMYRFIFPKKAVQILYIVSMLGMMVGPVLILLMFSTEYAKTKKDLIEIQSPHEEDNVIHREFE